MVHVLYTEILKTVCQNNISLKRYCILKIGYLNKTLLFGLNVAFSNCHSPLPESAIEIWVLLRMGILSYSKGNISSSNKDIQKQFSLHERVYLNL